MMVAALAAPPAALVVTSQDTAGAGALQRRLEAKLAGSVIPAEVLAKRLAVAARAPSTDPVLQREAERLFEATQKAFYGGNLDDAVARIADLDKLTLDTPALPMRERGRMLLWRAAVFLEVPVTKAAADAPVREALALVPDLVVDERSFPPQLVALATRTRKSLRRVTLTISGLPAGAAMRVDDLDLPAPAIAGAPFVVSVPGGRHRLQAWAAGFDTATIAVEVPLDVTLTLHLPLALDPADALALAESATGTAADERLAALARKLDVGVLAVVTQRSVGATIAAFVWRGTIERAPAFPATAAGEDSLALWLAQRLASKSSSKPPRPPRARGDGALALTPAVAAIGAVRTYDVAGKGSGYSAMFGGAGLRASGVGTWRSVLATAEASYVSYALSPATADLADGRRATGNGGSTTTFLAAGGWRLQSTGFSPYAVAGASLEQHTANDLVTSGGSLHFFPSHRRVALEVLAGVTWPRSFGVLQGRVMVQPYSTYEESPSANGGSPSPQIGVGWELGLERPRGAWLLSARARGERRSVDFRGTADAPLSPSVRDARVTETNHSLLITAGRKF